MKNRERNKIVILELNEFEFSPGWQNKYPLFSNECPDNLYLSQTSPDEEIEFNGLDPWVQWPTIHNQVPTEVHGQLRHGSLGNNCATKKSIFKILESSSLSYIAWGIMNPSHSTKENILLADPWSKNIISQPVELEKFISPIRYLAENYHRPKFKSLAPKVINSLLYIFLKLKFRELLKALYESYVIVLKAKKINSSVIFMLFENISMHLYQKFDQNKNISFIFLNSAAHFQHNHRKDKSTQKALDYFLAGIMRTLKARSENKNQEMAIITALTQKEASDIFVYNFYDGAKFLSDILGIKFQNLYIGMTSELNFEIKDTNDLKKIEQLKNVKVSSHNVFFVEVIKERDYYQVFIQAIIDVDVKKKEVLKLGDKTAFFYEIFYPYRERVGVHIPVGYLLHKKKTSTLPNQGIMKFLLKDYLT